MTQRANLITRIIAGILATVGLIWAFYLAYSILLIIGIFINMLFLPGWACFFGWIKIALGKQLEMTERKFWILSVVAHCWLLSVLIFFGYTAKQTNKDVGDIDWSSMSGIIFPLILSGVGAILCKTEKQTAENKLY